MVPLLGIGLCVGAAVAMYVIHEPMAWVQILIWIVMPLVGSVIVGCGAFWLLRYSP
jgi:hypothetical protein